MNSGIYIRVGAENKLLEQMTEKERMEWLEGIKKDGLIRCVNALSEVLYEYEKMIERIKNEYR